MIAFRHYTFVAVLLVFAVTSSRAEELNNADLKSVVTKYWTAVVEQDWQQAYQLEQAAHGESPRNALEYYKGWESSPRHARFTVDSVEEEGDNGTALISTAFVLPLGPKAVEIPKVYRSDWKRVNGSWLHVRSERAQR